MTFTLDDLGDLACGRCLSILRRLRMDPERYDWHPEGSKMHGFSRWNGRSICGHV